MKVDEATSDKTLNSLNRLAGVVILAGGNSTRMGTPKALLTLPTGERLLDYHIRHALALDVPILLADNAHNFAIDAELLHQATVSRIKDYDAADRNYVDSSYVDSSNQGDYKKTGGALAAIAAALQTLKKPLVKHHEQKSWLLVISCDSLIPAPDLWQKLQAAIMQANDRQVICLADAEHLYPLLGLYQLSLAYELKGYLDNNQRRVIPFIEPIVHTIALPEQWHDLTNFNTPSAFKRAIKSLDRQV